MTDRPQSLRELYADAEAKKADLDSAASTNTATYQENLSTTIAQYTTCLDLIDRLALFSPNESLEDISTQDLKYLLIQHTLADLTLRIASDPRVAHVRNAQQYYISFLSLLDDYDLLPAPSARLYDALRESPATFSPSPADAAKRREVKIERYRAEKDLKAKLDHLRANPAALANDEGMQRRLWQTQIELAVGSTWTALEGVSLELQMLAHASSLPARDARAAEDRRERGSGGDGYDERLDTAARRPLAGLSGPMLSADGKPMRPFTLVGGRQRVQDGVFRPDHSLPTMSIDEYLAEEKRRGGIIEGGGEASGIREQVDEDDHEAADRATMKARDWDEYVEANPKGSGNTLNNG